MKKCMNQHCGENIHGNGVELQITYRDGSEEKKAAFVACDLACLSAAQAAHAEKCAIAGEFVLPREVGWIGMMMKARLASAHRMVS